MISLPIASVCLIWFLCVSLPLESREELRERGIRRERRWVETWVRPIRYSPVNRVEAHYIGGTSKIVCRIDDTLKLFDGDNSKAVIAEHSGRKGGHPHRRTGSTTDGRLLYRRECGRGRSNRIATDNNIGSICRR